MATVIDSLLVTLGLDTSNWTKGRQVAAKETEETRRKTKGAADDITKSLLEVGKTIGGLFLGFESISGFTKFLAGLNEGEAALGRTAANIGMSAHELNKWGSAVTLAGGSATDAQAAFSQLTEDFQKMATTGEQSALLQFFRARNVNIRDENGNLRDQGKLYEELADKTAQYGRAYQVTQFRAIGLSQGYINYLVQTKAAREEQLRIAERDNGVTEESVKKAAELQQYWRGIGIEVAQIGQKILLEVTPYVKVAFGWATKLMDAFRDTGPLSAVGAIFRGIWNTVQAIFNGWKLLLDWLTNNTAFKAWNKYVNFFGDLYSKGLTAVGDVLGYAANPDGKTPGPADVAATPGTYIPPKGTKADRFNNPGNILNRDGSEKYYATLEEGQAALENDIKAKLRRGLNTVDKLVTAYEGNDTIRNDIPAYIADIRKKLGKNDLSETDVKQLAFAMATHESGRSRLASPTPSLGSVSGKIDRSGGNSTVSVGAIHVNAPNADPQAVAEKIPEAIQRKFAVTQADTGQS